jgi:hypothetical protein
MISKLPFLDKGLVVIIITEEVVEEMAEVEVVVVDHYTNILY